MVTLKNELTEQGLGTGCSLSHRVFRIHSFSKESDDESSWTNLIRSMRAKLPYDKLFPCSARTCVDHQFSGATNSLPRKGPHLRAILYLHKERLASLKLHDSRPRKGISNDLTRSCWAISHQFFPAFSSTQLVNRNCGIITKLSCPI